MKNNKTDYLIYKVNDLYNKLQLQEEKNKRLENKNRDLKEELKEYKYPSITMTYDDEGIDNTKIETVEDKDEEIVEIFIDEVFEQTKNILNNIDNYNIDDSVSYNFDMKRSFYTISKAGENLGFKYIGDAANIIEEFIKDKLEHEKHYVFNIVEIKFIKRATEELYEWNKQLKNKGEVVIDHNFDETINIEFNKVY